MRYVPRFVFTGLVSLLLFAFSPIISAEAATPRLSEENGYGRMVFTFQGGAPGYRATINSGVLVLTFDEKADINPEHFVLRMPRYVALARLDETGRTLRLALTTDFRLDTKTAEGSLYIDLLPPDWRGAPPPLPAEVIARQEAAEAERRKAEEAALLAKARGIVEPEAPQPELAVRAVTREGMTRILFDWNQPVLYSLTQREGFATLTFDRTAKVNLSRLRVDPPPYLNNVTATEHEGRLAVILTLKPGVVISDFREDMGVVLDLKPARSAPARTSSDEAGAKETSPAQAAEQGEPLSLSAEAVKKNEAQSAPVAIPAAAPAEKMLEPRAALVERNVMPEAARPEGKAVVKIVPGRGTMDVVVTWPEPVGAAIFERGEKLWAVFDEALPVDLPAMDGDQSGPFGAMEVTNIKGGSVLSISLRGKMLVGAVEEGSSWRISAGETLSMTGRPMGISRNWRADGRGSVSFDLRAARKVLSLPEGIMSERIMVATARGPAQSLHASRSLVEFQALQTVQGIAILPLADNINLAIAPEHVIVSRNEGLTLSADDHRDSLSVAERGKAGRNFASQPVHAEMKFGEWRHAPGETFIERRQYHLSRLVDAPTHELGRIRFEYGRFLLGYGLAHEARAMLEKVVEVNPRYVNDPSFRAAKGVAEIMSRRYVEGINDLSAPGLENAPHAAIWRAYARAELGHWEAARTQFGLAGAVIDAFDDDLRSIFRARAVRAALEGGKVDAAHDYAAGFPADVRGAQARAEILLSHALVADAQKRSEEAIARYEMAIADNYPPVAARARFGKAVLQYEAGKIDAEAFTRELKELRFAWRGDELELAVLTRLAELNLEQGETADALRHMRVATANFPDSDEAHRMNLRMSDIFAEFFLSNAIDSMPPVQALAFFDNFKELTPIGQKGDEMIRNLAERLVAVDLLPQAQHLLDYQVANRLHGGVAKAQVAARLAALYLMDHKPEQALAALRATRQNILPDELAERRLLLEARALANLRQYDNALDLLDGMRGEAARRLQADVMWDGGRWAEAGGVIEELLGDLWKDDKLLSPEMRFLVMRGAIAYSLASNEAGLSRMRMKFGPAMYQSPDANAFAVVADPIAQQGVAFREMASRIASIGTLDQFLASLRDGATAIN